MESDKPAITLLQDRLKKPVKPPRWRVSKFVVLLCCFIIGIEMVFIDNDFLPLMLILTCCPLMFFLQRPRIKIKEGRLIIVDSFSLKWKRELSLVNIKAYIRYKRHTSAKGFRSANSGLAIHLKGEKQAIHIQDYYVGYLEVQKWLVEFYEEKLELFPKNTFYVEYEPY